MKNLVRAGSSAVLLLAMMFVGSLVLWVGLPLAPALAGVLVYRLFNFWLPIVPALALLPSVSELRRAFEQPDALETP